MMHSSILSHKLEKELREIFSIRPNDLGNRHLTSMYKFVTGPLKQMPFIYVLPTALILAMMLYIVLGQLVIKIVSLLQYAF